MNLFHASAPCSQCDVEKLKCISMHYKLALDHCGKDVCGCADSVKVNVDDRLPVIQTPNRLSIGTVYNHSFAILPILWGRISHGSDSEAYRTISCSLISISLAQRWTDPPPSLEFMGSTLEPACLTMDQKGRPFPPDKMKNQSSPLPYLGIAGPWHFSPCMVNFLLHICQNSRCCT